MSAALQAKIEVASKAIKDNQENYDKLINYAQTMTKGYIGSIQLVIDVTKVLSSVKKFLDDISGLGIKTDQLKNLKTETAKNLTVLSDTLKAQLDTISDLVADGATQSHIVAIRDAVAATQTGGLKGQKKAKVIRRRISSTQKIKKTK